MTTVVLGTHTPKQVEWVRPGLIWTLVRTDFKARYHGTLGGFVWALLKPMCMFVVLMGVFSFLFASNPTYKLDLIIGLFLWDFFAEGTKSGLLSLQARGYLLTKASVPPWILVVTSISNAVITLGVFSLVMTIFLASAGHMPTGPQLLAFSGVLRGVDGDCRRLLAGSERAVLALSRPQPGVGRRSSGGLLHRADYLPLNILPERFHFYLYVWPPTPVIEFSRAALVAGRIPTVTGHVYLAIDAAVCLIAGAAIFRQLSPHAAEYV